MGVKGILYFFKYIFYVKCQPVLGLNDRFRGNGKQKETNVLFWLTRVSPDDIIDVWGRVGSTGASCGGLQAEVPSTLVKLGGKQ